MDVEIHQYLLLNRKLTDFTSITLYLLKFFRGTLRKLLALHVFTVRRPNFDRFFEE